MNLATTISIYAGGPGSGCNPDAGKCGRPVGTGGVHALDNISHDEIMQPIGSVSIPSGTVRLYHFTGGEDLDGTRKNLASIMDNGLLRDKAQGASYGEPSVIWGSTAVPRDFKHFVEFYAKPDQIGLGSPWHGANATRNATQAQIDEFQKGNHDVTIFGDVPREQIVAVHEPWHSDYRYIGEDPDVQADIRKGGFNYLLDPSSKWSNNNDKTYMAVTQWIKRHPKDAPLTKWKK